MPNPVPQIFLSGLKCLQKAMTSQTYLLLLLLMLIKVCLGVVIGAVNALRSNTISIAGTVVGAAGTLLTQLMAKAMNKTLISVLFPFGETTQASGDAVEGEMKPIEAGDAGIMMAFAQKVIIIPGYGMAVAQAQQKVWELSQLLIDRLKRFVFWIMGLKQNQTFVLSSSASSVLQN